MKDKAIQVRGSNFAYFFFGCEFGPWGGEPREVNGRTYFFKSKGLSEKEITTRLEMYDHDIRNGGDLGKTLTMTVESY